MYENRPRPPVKSARDRAGSDVAIGDQAMGANVAQANDSARGSPAISMAGRLFQSHVWTVVECGSKAGMTTSN